MMKILEILFLFLAIWWSLINITKGTRGESIPAGNFFYQAISIVGFIICRFYI